MSTQSRMAYVNAKVFTADEAGSRASAIATEGSRIIYVGDDAGAREAAGPEAEVIDLEGRMVMPGIHDGHTHLLLSGMLRTVEAQITPMADADQVVRDLMASAGVPCAHDDQADGHDEWLVAGVLNPTPFEDLSPDRAFLDEAFPDRPVVIYDWSMHNLLANRRALELAGVDPEAPEPPGGRRIRRSDGGELTGLMVEQARWQVQRALPPYAPDVYRGALSYAVETCNRFGITSVQEATAVLPELNALSELDATGDLSLHVAAHLVWREEGFGAASLEELERIIAERDQYATEHVDTAFVKFFMDGIPLPPHFTSCELVDNEPQRDKVLIPQDEFEDALRRFDAAGLKIKLHCAGAGAVRVALDGYQVMREANGQSGIQHDVAHATWISDQDLARFSELDVNAELSPAVWNDPTFAEMLTTGYRFATMKEHNISMTVGSDWVVTDTPNLFPGLQGIVLRGEESLGLEEGLRMLTIEGARSVRRADERGSIETGKSADFIVLDRDLFEVAPEQIGETVVLRTVFEGRTVYSAEG